MLSSQRRFPLLILSSLLWCASLCGAQSVATQTTLTVSSAQLASGPSIVTCVATVSSIAGPAAAGSVDFFEGSRLLGTAQIVRSTAAAGTLGSAVLKRFLGLGNHAVTASFRGTSLLQASHSNVQTANVAGTKSNGPDLSVTATYPNPGSADSLEHMAVGDLNNDGLPDIAVPLLSAGEVWIYFNDPAHPGTFQKSVLNMPFPRVPADRAVIGDLDGDGLLDLVVLTPEDESGDTDYSGGYITIFHQSSAHPGTFDAPVLLYDDYIVPEALALADLDGDGRLDIVFSGPYNNFGHYGYGIAVYTQSTTTPGKFPVRPDFIDVDSTLFTSMTVADLNGDGLPEIILSGENFAAANAPVRVYYADPAIPGTFHNRQDFLGPNDAYDMVAADFQNSGHVDLAFSGVISKRLETMLHSAADPTQFSTGNSFPTFASPLSIASGDLQGTGNVDIVLGGYSSGASVYAGDGKGAFAAPKTYGLGSGVNVQNLGVGDLDGDGLDDLVVTTAPAVYQSGFSGSLNILTHAASTGLITPAMAFTISATAVNLGTPVTFTARLSSVGGIQPTGTVVFSDGSFTLGTGAVQADGLVAINVQAPLAGTRTVTASYSGDTRYTAVQQQGSFSVTGGAPTVTLNANPSSAVLGEKVMLTSRVTGTGPTPTGDLHLVYTTSYETLLLDATLDATGSVTYQLDTSTLRVGTNELDAYYFGDSVYRNGYAQFKLVLSAPPTITLSSSVYSSVAGQAVSFTATLANLSPLTGQSVSFYDGAALLGTQTTDASGTTSLQVSTLPVGTHSVTAKFSPNGSNAVYTTYPLSFTVTGASSSTGLTVTPAAPVVGQPVTLVAIVKAAGSSAAIPTGTVRFLDGSTVLATSALDAMGKATSVLGSLSPGGHSFTAQYTGDAKFSPSSSSLGITVPVADFSLTSDKNALTLSLGGSGTVNLALATSTGFSDTVQLSCSGLPTGANCVFSPQNVSVNSSAATASVTIQAPYTISMSSRPSPFWASLLAFMPLIALRGKTHFRSKILFASAIFIALGTISGCSGSGGLSAPAPPQTRTVTIQIMGKAISGTQNHSVSISLTY